MHFVVNILELVNGKNLAGILGELIVEAGFDGVARGSKVAQILELAMGGYWRKARPVKSHACRLIYEGIGSLCKPVGEVRCANYALPSEVNRKWVKAVVSEGWYGLWLYPPCVTHVNPIREFCLVEECVKAVLNNGLWGLMRWLEGGDYDGVRGLEAFKEAERIVARELMRRLIAYDKQFVGEIIRAIGQGDFFVMDGDKVVYIEVKTGRSRVGYSVVERARLLSEISVETVVARVVPRENWNVEIEVTELRSLGSSRPSSRSEGDPLT